MLFCLDVGNTNISLGCFSGELLRFVSRMATDRSKTPDQFAVEIKGIFGLHGVAPGEITGAIISSVVPEITLCIAQGVETLTGRAPLVLTPGVKTGVNILVDDPAQVGSDLVAGVAAAAALYPLPCLIIDLGTATKISVVDENGAFCGCTITSGVSISLEALSARTSQLPNISLTAPSRVIGKNTVDSMRSGTVYGAAAMLDGLCAKIASELNSPVKSVVATGGLAREIVKSCKTEIILNSELLLWGLKRIFEKNQ